MNLHPQDQIELESRSVNDTVLRDQIAALTQLMKATPQASSPASWLHEAGEIPSPASPHENGGEVGTRGTETLKGSAPGKPRTETPFESARPLHHCIGLCDPERHGPFDTELDWYYAEGL